MPSSDALHRLRRRVGQRAGRSSSAARARTAAPLQLQVPVAVAVAVAPGALPGKGAYVQWGRLGDLEGAPLKGFEATTRTAVKNLYR